MKQETIAIIKWQYWLYNHGEPKQILQECFPDLWQHFYDKLNHYANKTGNTAFAWSYWFMDLSTDRQEKFAEWVCKNYHGVDRRIKMTEGGDQ
jgi:hypothetical protein